jgi:tetratricopeptide (TPR) repeat protein
MEGAAARYRLLESVRQYAAQQLDVSGEGTSIRARHRDCYLALAERALPHLTGGNQLRWYEQLAADYDNFRVALSWSRADPHGAEAELRMVAALGRFWHMWGPMSEGREWLADALARNPATPSVAYVTALDWAGIAALRYEESDIAQSFLSQSVELARHLADSRPRTIAMRHLAMVLHRREQDDSARALLQTALEIARAVADAREIAFSLCYLGTIADDDGDVGSAQQLYDEALSAGEDSGDALPLSHVLVNLAELCLRQGEIRRARDRCRQGLDVARLAGDRPLMAANLLLMGSLNVAAGRLEWAAVLFGAEAAWSARQGMSHQRLFPLTRRRAAEATRYADEVRAVRSTLGDEVFHRSWTRGQGMTVEEATGLVLNECAAGIG